MGLVTKLYNFLFPKEEPQCLADMSNSECSLVSELREIQKEINEITKDGCWEYSKDFNYNSIKFRFTYKNDVGKKDYSKYSNEELSKTYEKLLLDLSRIIILQDKELKLKEQLGIT